MYTFNVLGVIERSDEYGHAFTTVNVAMDAKLWLKLKRQGKLGMLYGVDISNEVYRSHGIPAHNPSVDDKRRSVKGVKHIQLTYYAKASAECVARYSPIGVAKPKDNVPKLRLIHCG